MELAATMTADEGGIATDAVAALQLARTGDLAAFERLMRYYERRVFRIALRLLDNRADAQDAAQEVFLCLHRNLRRLDADRDPGAWIYRVAVNVCRDMARGHVQTQPLGESASSVLPADEEIGRAERTRLVARALRSLTEKQRAAVVMRDIEGLPTSEVARVLGSSEATVRSHVSTARLRIKAFIEGLTRRRV